MNGYNMSQLDVELIIFPVVQNIWFRCGFTPALIAIRAHILQEFLHSYSAIIIHSNYHYS